MALLFVSELTFGLQGEDNTPSLFFGGGGSALYQSLFTVSEH